MANRATGKGYENETFYTNIKFQFWGIDNIHVMRASLQKLVEGSSLMACVSWHSWLVYVPLVQAGSAACTGSASFAAADILQARRHGVPVHPWTWTGLPG